MTFITAEEHTHHDCQVTELEARLDLTKVSLEEIRQECAALQDKNKQLLDALNIQKVITRSLCVCQLQGCPFTQTTLTISIPLFDRNLRGNPSRK